MCINADACMALAYAAPQEHYITFLMTFHMLWPPTFSTPAFSIPVIYSCFSVPHFAVKQVFDILSVGLHHSLSRLIFIPPNSCIWDLACIWDPAYVWGRASIWGFKVHQTNLCYKTIAIIVQYQNRFDNIHWGFLQHTLWQDFTQCCQCH